MPGRAVALVVGLAFLAATGAVGGQAMAVRAVAETTRVAGEPAPFVGQTGEATRSFRARGARLEGPILFVFAVVELETGEDAEAAFMVVQDGIGSDPDTAGLSRVDEPSLGDEAAAFGGASSRDGFTVTMAVLVVRADRFVHTWRAAGLATDPLPDLLAVAERGFEAAAGTEGTPEATPDPDDLLDRLPDEDDLPSGFTLEFEEERGGSTEADETPDAPSEA